MRNKKKEKQNLETRPIQDFNGYNFFVDDYQRGYKWTIQQILDLLNDINTFNPKEDAFYCLQPLVVKERSVQNEKIKETFKNNIEDSKNGNPNEIKNIYEVIDGQQRITSIYIILGLLDKPIYTIKYQTREASAKFLENINTNLNHISLLEFNKYVKDGRKYITQINDEWGKYIEDNKEYDNIDNYHFFMAFITAKSWIKHLDSDERKMLVEKIKNDTHFIWYEDKKHNNSKAVFRNLNSGKTDLTNAELIKALFINNCESDNKEVRELKQNDLAREWDHFEKRLNEDSFWFFISNEVDKTKYPTRIDFLFELVVGKKFNKDDELFTYRQYANGYVDLDWSAIKELFYQLQDWYEDRSFYHLIGYIIYAKLKTIREIRKKAESCGKKEFKEKLIVIIKNEFASIDKKSGEAIYDFDTLGYYTKDDAALKVLLLHNIETYEKSDSAFRFPFDKLKNEKWSIEHVHAQNAADFNKKEELIAWLEDLLGLSDTWESEENLVLKKLISEINSFKDEVYKLDGQITEDIKQQRDIIKEKTDEFFNMHHISNLALLDEITNIKLSNKTFKHKRKKVIEIDQKEWQFDKKNNKTKAFIPIATKYAFLKYYSDDAKQTEFWASNDRTDYVNNIRTTLTNYLNLKD